MGGCLSLVYNYIFGVSYHITEPVASVGKVQLGMVCMRGAARRRRHDEDRLRGRETPDYLLETLRQDGSCTTTGASLS